MTCRQLFRMEFLILVFVLLLTPTLAAAQEGVYLPYIGGAHEEKLERDVGDILPGLTIVADVQPDDSDILPDSPPSDDIADWIPEFEAAALPVPTVGPESRRQDTDGLYTLPPIAQAATVLAYDDPDDFTIAGRLGVGTDAPSYNVDVVAVDNGATRLRVQNTSSGANAWADVAITTGPGKGYAIQKFGANFNTFTWSGMSLADWARFRSDSGVAGLIFTTGGYGPLILGTNDAARMLINGGGQVAIGTMYPSNYARFTVDGFAGYIGGVFRNASLGLLVQASGDGVLVTNPGHVGVGIHSPGNNGIEVSSAGADGISVSTPTGDGLSVADPGDNGLQVIYSTYTGKDGIWVSNGNIFVSNGSYIDDGTTLNVPDYVFEDEYPLMDLGELRTFVAKNKHLPNVPSEDEVKANGIDLSAFNMSLLEKVEEQTLYILQLEDDVTHLRARVDALEDGQVLGR